MLKRLLIFCAQPCRFPKSKPRRCRRRSWQYLAPHPYLKQIFLNFIGEVEGEGVFAAGPDGPYNRFAIPAFKMVYTRYFKKE